MEFSEKLQQLRKKRGLTQEELAELLYVSRTAVSKWESGRGYPNIESLKEISKIFSVTVDDLLSGEKLISLAEKENRSNIQNICGLLFGIADLFSVLLVILPLYPNVFEGYVYSVNLFEYWQTSPFNKWVYFLVPVLISVAGLVKIVLTRMGTEKSNKAVTVVSLTVNIFAVIFFGLSREAYAVIIAFFILLTKGIILLRQKE